MSVRLPDSRQVSTCCVTCAVDHRIAVGESGRSGDRTSSPPSAAAKRSIASATQPR
ncbi:MAG TPA: hypothetical protein VI076_14545 [Actinopolymorphaceae bacterium]